MTKEADIKQQILDSALKLAEKSSWEEIRLNDIAADLGISLLDIQQHYQQKDDLVEAWFDRADQAMLGLPLNELAALELVDRLHTIIFSWLDALAMHKTITRDMLWYKLEPIHIHLQIHGLLRISRTVQWIIELAGIKSSNIARIIDEVGLTSVYVCTFLYWLKDASAEQQRTHQFLRTRLNCMQGYRCNSKHFI